MKALFISLLLIAVPQAFGATKLDQDIETLAQLVDVGTNGGDVRIVNYDVKKFKYKPLVENLASSIEGNSCGYRLAVGRARVLSSDFIILTPEAIELLERLNKEGKLKAALGYYWDWTSDQGDSEYCSTETLDLYFTNGKALLITYDSTT